MERVEPGSAPEQAGLLPADVLLGWTRAAAPPANPSPASGTFVSPSDLDALEIEQAPRGAVTLLVERDGARRQVTLPLGRWSLETRPRLPDELVEAYLAGRSASQSKDTAEAARGRALWRALARQVAERGDARSAAWLLLRVAQARAPDRPAEEVARDFAAAADGLPDDPAWVAYARSHEAFALESRNREIERALALRREALRLRESLDSHSLGVAHTLNVLAIVERECGQLDQAETHNRRALAIRRQAAPRSLALANSLNNLANVALARGDLKAAEDLMCEALALRRELQPGGADVAQSLNNLGGVAWSRGDPAAAQAYFEEALQIQQRLDRRSLAAAAMLTNLGAVAFESGRVPEAERFFERALAIEQELSPDGIEVAGSLVNLGQAAAARGARPEARRRLERALAIQTRLVPGSLALCETLTQLGELMADEADLAGAEAVHRRALALRAQLAPGSTLEAESHHALAGVALRAGRPAAALEAELRALEALDAQSARLGGSHEARARYLARYAGWYREAIDLLLRLGRPEEAFHVLERSRARGLLALLAERDLVFDDVPADLARLQRATDAEHDRLLAELAELSGEGDDEPRAALRRRLDAVRLRQEELRADVRRAAPRLASLRYPEPLDLAATRQVLDPGTLLLSYSLGEPSSVVFATGPGALDFAAFDIDSGAAALQAGVEAFRGQILRGRAGGGEARLRLLAQSLGTRLLGPVADLVARAERVVIVPDGPLHVLPFAALADPGGGTTFHWLVEGRPVHVVSSASVLAQLRKQRPARTDELTLAAFGNPDYSARAAGPTARAESRDSRPGTHASRLSPLPGTRAEVEHLRALFPERARVFLGPEATEEQVKALGDSARLIHFACHGLLDSRFPLESALALSFPARAAAGRENGLLQAWEIFEHVRLDADLVTLSACETDLGEKQGGEGLLGLRRAFHFAGARNVVASLWSVDDDATATLMERFYRAIRSDARIDEALRQAQLDALRDPARAHPAYWAAFQLSGDGR